MTPEPPGDDRESLSAKTCGECGRDVPAGRFCDACGATLSRRRGDGRPRWRLRAYAAAPDEHVLWPSVTTALLTQLPRRSRRAFRLSLVVLLVLLVGFVLLKWQPPLIGLSALGLPLLFVVYLRETSAFEELSVVALAVSAGLGSALGVGWALATDAIWARTYDDVLGTPMTPTESLINLVIIPIAGLLLTLVPVAVLRARRPETAKSLDGFVLGALAALGFTAAGILTRAAPEFANGLVSKDFPMDALWALAAIRGVATPLTAAAVGGMVGATLWFRLRTDPAFERHWYSPAAPGPAIVIALLAYGGQNLIDYAWISYTQIVVLYAGIALLALLALRIVLHATLLGEKSDGIDGGEAMPCPQCEHVVPDRGFCPNCGYALNAARRNPGQAATRPALSWGMAAAVVVAVAIGLSLWLTPAPASYTCPPDCGRPPIGQPVATNPRFSSADGAFSVSYPGPGTAYETTLESDGVTAELVAGDGGTLHLFGEPAADRTPRQIAEGLIDDNFSDATIDYEIPNAQVGYQAGYGVIADVYKAGSAGDSARLRVLVMVAVKHDLALVAIGAGTYREFTPEFGSGHPSGANFQLALDMSKYVNSFTWRGDPPR